MGELVELVRALEGDHRLLEQFRAQQEAKVDEWCYRNPAHNLETMLQAFRSSNSFTGQTEASRGASACRGGRRARRVAHRCVEHDAPCGERGCVDRDIHATNDILMNAAAAASAAAQRTPWFAAHVSSPSG